MEQQLLMWIIGGVFGTLLTGGAMMWMRKVSASLDTINETLREGAHFQGAVDGYIKDSDRRFDEQGKRLDRLEQNALSH